ncbi:helix-turn-helix domain-containing protein [Sphingomonas sp. CBMAI 2297]|uniref:helix-turn-helix domain-containing protein n=1 Tax=Sphingomonas sp. CBMAI 2297 TaxID=2991720 RepID=UPI0024546E88|nr:helix-turn-helix transcriptional regulator [Sphingomonas sp. CBMAI 2297]MDH4745805.1 helix-turn-helix domain-containing protein [Sphingomonas sp. CBMAI 2297]
MQGPDIKAIRKWLGLSQEEFAAQIGLTRISLGTMERGGPIEPRTEKLIDATMRHHIDVSYSGALGKWTVALRGPAAPNSGAHRMHLILRAVYDQAEAIEIAETEKRERYPFAFITIWPGPSHGAASSLDASASNAAVILDASASNAAAVDANGSVRSASEVAGLIAPRGD